jgi:hypothetical protein
MIILQLPTSEELWMTDDNESAVKDVLKNIPDDMVITILDRNFVVLDKLTKHELFSY